MQIKVDCKRLLGIVLFLSFFCILYGSLYRYCFGEKISLESSHTIVEADGSYIVTKSYADGSKIREEYDAFGELSCIISTIQEKGFSVAITERVDSEYVYLSVTDEALEQTTVYRKPKNAPDAAYAILYSD